MSHKPNTRTTTATTRICSFRLPHEIANALKAMPNQSAYAVEALREKMEREAKQAAAQ